MLVLIVLALSWNRISSDTSVRERVVWLCKSLREIDARITGTLTDLHENGGEYVLKDMSDYNAGLKRLLQLLTEQRNATLQVDVAVELLKTGAPAYYRVKIDNDKTKSSWGWLQEGMDRVYKLIATSINIWREINRLSQLNHKLFYFGFPN